MSQPTLIREKGGVGGIRYSAQNSLRERNFAYIKNPIQLVSFFFFVNLQRNSSTHCRLD